MTPEAHAPVATGDRLPELVDVLGGTRRQLLLRTVVDRGVAGVEELAAAVAAAEDEEFAPTERRELRLEVRLVHLQALADANLVAYDADREAVVPTVTADLLFECLDQICEGEAV